MAARSDAGLFQIEQPIRNAHANLNRKNSVTKEKWCRVPCPTCGVYVGQRCLTHSGAHRDESHTLRKVAVMERLQQRTPPVRPIILWRTNWGIRRAKVMWDVRK